ncbi:MAG: hypothetical protein WBW89_10795, partial [Candidatus Cybelea sp.]
QARSRIGKRAIVAGRVGPRVVTFFSRIGPNAIGLLLAVLYVALAVPFETTPPNAADWPDAR